MVLRKDLVQRSRTTKKKGIMEGMEKAAIRWEGPFEVWLNKGVLGEYVRYLSEASGAWLVTAW